MERLIKYLRTRFTITPLSKDQAEILARIKHPCC